MSCIAHTSAHVAKCECMRPGHKTPGCKSPLITLQTPLPPPLPAADLAQFLAGYKSRHWHGPCTYINASGTVCGSKVENDSHFARCHVLAEACLWHKAGYDPRRLPHRDAWLLNTREMAEFAETYIVPCPKCEMRFSWRHVALDHVDGVHGGGKIRKIVEDMEIPGIKTLLEWLRGIAEERERTNAEKA